MQRLFKILMVLALAMSFGANCSAETVGISEDGLENFLSKCNQVLSAEDAESKFDMPKQIDAGSETFTHYLDTVPVDENISVQITYALKDNKVFGLRLYANGYDETVQNCLEGLSIIYLRASGLSEDEAQNLSNGAGQTSWQNAGKVSRLNKSFIVKLQSSEETHQAEMLIMADDAI